MLLYYYNIVFCPKKRDLSALLDVNVTGRHRAWMVALFYAADEAITQRKQSSRIDATASFTGAVASSATLVSKMLKCIPVNKKNRMMQ